MKTEATIKQGWSDSKITLEILSPKNNFEYRLDLNSWEMRKF